MEFTVLTDTLNNFITVFSAAWGNLAPSINWLIATLLAIELVMIGLWWALGGGEQIVNVFKKLLFILFWVWFVTEFPSLADAFVRSLIRAGEIASGSVPGTSTIFDPSKIAGYGIDATAVLVYKLESIKFGFVDAIIIGISYILIMLSFLLIAWQCFYAVLEYYLLLSICGILLPFGLLKQTKFIAEKPIGAIISSGIKLMVLSFIISVIEPTLSTLRFTAADPSFNEIFSMFLTVGGIAYLAWQAPGVAAGLLAGSPSLSAGGALQTLATGSVLGGIAAQGLSSATRTASSAISSGASVGTRLAGATKTGAQMAYQSAKMGGASTAGAIVSGIGGGLKGASGLVTTPLKESIKSNLSKGAALSGYSTGSTATSNIKPDQWAGNALKNMKSTKTDKI